MSHDKKQFDENLNYINAVESGYFPDDPRVPLSDYFEDERGKIQNLLFMNEGVKSVAIITSKAGTERSNHWHRTDWHFLYVLSGEMTYYERHLDINLPQIVLTVKEGEMVFTPPRRVHKTFFTKDTVLLSCAKNVRSYKKHEQDMVTEIF